MKGFSLFELLVSAVVLGFFAALVFGARAAGREKEDLASCAYRLGNLGRAAELYMQDNSGYLIISGSWTVGTALGESWPTQRYLARGGYMRRMDNWVCPSLPPFDYDRRHPTRTYAVLRSNAGGRDEPSHENCTRFNERMWQALRYAYDADGAWLGRHGSYIYFPAISSPSEYFLVGEQSSGDGYQTGNWMRRHPGVALHMRHGDVTNLLFADGGVRAADREMLRELDAVDRIWKHDMSAWEQL